MYIRSELTGKDYKTVEDCLADEKEFERRKEEEEARAKEQEMIKEKAAKELAEAINKYCEITNSTLHDVTIALLDATMVEELGRLVE